MRDLFWTADFSDYRDYIRQQFFADLILDNQFYSNLVDYILVNRSPIFYYITELREHFSFSGAYNFQTIREYQDNPQLMLSLFFIHDFTHSLFPFPQHAANVSLQEFTDQFIYQERIASTESEILIYYRIPELRKQVFSKQKIYFDLLQQRGVKQPNPREFFIHRSRLIEDEQYAQQHLADHPEIYAFFTSWKTLTPKWCAERWQSLQSRQIPIYNWQRLNIDNYQAVITNYQLPSPSECQQLFDRNIIRNLNLAFGLLHSNRHTNCVKQIPEGLAYLENKAFFPEDKRVKTSKPAPVLN